MAVRPGDEKTKVFYKYRELAGQAPGTLNQNTTRLVCDGEMYFSAPGAFNDPFDCRVTLSSNSTMDELEQYLTRQGLPKPTPDVILKQIMSGALSLESFLPKDASSVSAMLRVYCLSTKNDNILMWSHYAKDHTGICVGMKVHFHENSLCLAVEPDCVSPIHASANTGLLPASFVRYDDSMPNPYNLFTGTTKDLEPFMLTKSKLWEYENEYRIMLFERIINRNPVVLADAEISEVIFGVRTPKALETAVISMLENCRATGPTVTFLKARLNNVSYRVDIGPY